MSMFSMRYYTQLLVIVIFFVACNDEDKGLTPRIKILWPLEQDTVHQDYVLVNVQVQDFESKNHQLYYQLNDGAEIEVFQWPFKVSSLAEKENAISVIVKSKEDILDEASVSVVFEKKTYIPDSVFVVNGMGSGIYSEGASVLINANASVEPYVFYYWKGDNRVLADSTLNPTFFHMPNENVRLEAIYYVADSSFLRRIQVDQGSGGGYYLPGDEVTLISELPEPLHFRFWSGLKGITADTLSTQVSFTMPDFDLEVQALWEAREVSYSRDLFPIINLNCNDAGCHDVNSAPSFVTYTSIAEKGENIVNKTQSRNMPPPRYRQLTDAELEIIRIWVEEGSLNN